MGIAVQVCRQKLHQHHVAKSQELRMAEGTLLRNWIDVVLEDRANVTDYIDVLKRGEHGIFVLISHGIGVHALPHRTQAFQ